MDPQTDLPVDQVIKWRQAKLVRFELKERGQHGTATCRCRQSDSDADFYQKHKVQHTASKKVETKLSGAPAGCSAHRSCDYSGPKVRI